MRFGRRIQEESETIQMAPLIDIVFLTLVFFMTTSVYSALESDLDINLPTADSAAESERAHGEIIVNLRADGSIIVNDRELDIDELQEILNRVAEHFKGAAIIIRGDREALYGGAVAILDCCRKADIQDVRLAALTNEQEGA